MGWLIAILVLLAIACAGTYFYYTYWMEQKEKADYARLDGVTNPEFYQQFLIDYPKSKHYDEINERMQLLLVEAADWENLQKNISRKNISSFLQKHPESLRQRACEDMLDSID